MNITIDVNGRTTLTDFSWQFGVGAPMPFSSIARICASMPNLRTTSSGSDISAFTASLTTTCCACSSSRAAIFFQAMPYGKDITEVNFLQVAKVYDNVIACSMKPFVELSFMPSALASGKRTGLRYRNNITQPKSLEKWCRFIKAFLRFLLHRYGKEEVESWYFEAWNEPDLGIFFKGKQEDYFRLYEATAHTVKKVDSALRVGGPSTSACR